MTLVVTMYFVSPPEQQVLYNYSNETQLLKEL